jgi:hypothetical protein
VIVLSGAGLAISLIASLASAQTVRAPGGALVTIPRSMDASDPPASASTGRVAGSDGALVRRINAEAGGASARSSVWPPAVQEFSGNGCSQAIVGKGQTYNVGPSQKYHELTEVPWLSLGPGDVVNIYARAEPYRTKIGLRAQGRSDAPVVINGVTDAACNRPVISGENAVTARDAAQRSFFSKQYSEMLGVFLLYKAPDDPWGYRPQHLQFRNLKITGGNKNNTYTAQDGSTGRYAGAAAAIYAVVVDDLLIENCEITGNGNGIFVNSKEDAQASSAVTLRANRIHANGNVGSWFEHNLYIQAARVLYEGNYIGQLVPGAKGSSLKDRSSATVVRYNHIVAAARALDLVEIEGGVKPVMDDPLYPHAWVYGNLIDDDWRLPGRASVKLVHWGGDNDPRYFRTGTLHFYNNTVRINADKLDFWYVALFDLPGETQKVALRANIFESRGSSELRLGAEAGTIELADGNWISSGWSEGSGGIKLQRSGQLIEGRSAGLDADGVPRVGSTAIDRGQLDLGRQPAGVQLDNLRVTHQYRAPAGIVARPVRGTAPELGAFETR